MAFCCYGCEWGLVGSISIEHTNKIELHLFGGYRSLYLRPECGGMHTISGEVHIAIYQRGKEFGLLVVSMLETNDSDGTSIGRVHRRCMRRYLAAAGSNSLRPKNESGEPHLQLVAARVRCAAASTHKTW
jgi:hypothetical protein